MKKKISKKEEKLMKENKKLQEFIDRTQNPESKKMIKLVYNYMDEYYKEWKKEQLNTKKNI